MSSAERLTKTLIHKARVKKAYAKILEAEGYSSKTETGDGSVSCVDETGSSPKEETEPGDETLVSAVNDRKRKGNQDSSQAMQFQNLTSEQLSSLYPRKPLSPSFSPHLKEAERRRKRLNPEEIEECREDSKRRRREIRAKWLGRSALNSQSPNNLQGSKFQSRNGQQPVRESKERTTSSVRGRGNRVNQPKLGDRVGVLLDKIKKSLET